MFVRIDRKARGARRQLDVAIDYHAFSPGDSVRQTVSEKVRESRRLIVLVSPNSAASDWVNAEVKEFRALNGSDAGIITILLEAADPIGPASFPPSLSSPDDFPASIDFRAFQQSGRVPMHELERVYAELLGISYEELRDRQRSYRAARRRRAALVATPVALGLSVVGILALDSQARLVLTDIRAIENPISEDTFSEAIAIVGPDGRFAKGFDDGRVRLIDGKHSRDLSDPLAGIVMDLEMYETESVVGVALKSPMVRLWSTATREMLWEYQNPLDVSFISIAVDSGSSALAAGADDGRVYYWPNGPAGHVEVIDPPALPDADSLGRVQDLKFSENGANLWIAYLDGLLGRYDLIVGKLEPIALDRVSMIYAIGEADSTLLVGCWGESDVGSSQQLLVRDPDGLTRIIETSDSIYNIVLPTRRRGGFISVSWTGETVLWDGEMRANARWRREAIARDSISADVYSVAYDPSSGWLCIYEPDRIGWYRLEVRTIWNLPWF
ncbi:MAG: toll/interleukin-1 receptor domain-containing protein [Planctomycetota bacterium]